MMKDNPDMLPVSRRDFTWAGILALVALLAFAIVCVRQADEAKPRDWLDDKLTYVPSGKLLKPMALGFDEAVADMLWIRGMIYFSDSYLQNKGYQWLGHIIDVVTTLNPRLRQAYEFAGVVLTKEKGDLPLTLRTLDRGIGQFPKDWRLRLYAAMGQLALDSNFVRAAELLQPITTQDDVPGHIKTMCATLLSKGGNRSAALGFLVDRYLESKNPINQEVFVEKILNLFPETAGIPEKTRKRVAGKVLREARVEPMAKYMVLEVLADYLGGGALSPKVQVLLRLIGEGP